ncbi:MAG: hypothetical protein LPK45_03790 [Bacteroidota bacterium]|nr:hypothetical protein [Bacteroidota bacterium]MDX5468935.1 hypothetical protein [Bacteroidota bacterium]
MMKKLLLMSAAIALTALAIAFRPEKPSGGCTLEFAILKKADTAYISDLHFCDYRAYQFTRDIARQYQDTIPESDLRDLKYETLIISNGVYVRGETEEPSRKMMNATRQKMLNELKMEFKTVLAVKTSH